MVQGHVDCTAEILERWQNEAAVHYRFRLPESVAPFVVEKGYVAIDGISLTVVSVSARNMPMKDQRTLNSDQ